MQGDPEASPPPKSTFREKLERSIDRFLDGLSIARVVLMILIFLIFLMSILIYFSEEGAISYIDAVYISAATLCVTGLSPVPLSGLSHLSHWIIMIGIQLGGLGIISFTVIIGILIVRGESRNVKFNIFVREAIDATEEKEVSHKYNSTEVRRILYSVVNISLTLEFLGAIAIYNVFPEDLPPGVNRVFFSVFTSISSFNNAGFSLVDDLSLIAFHPMSMYIVSSLIIFGGIGFPVIIYLEKIALQGLQKIAYHVESRLETYFYSKIITNPTLEKFPIFYETFIKFSHYLDEKIEDYNSHLHGESNRIQYKILFYGSLILLLIGTVSFLLLESSNPHTLYGMDWDVKFANAFFLSACSRTAGFSTLDIMSLQDPSLVIVAILMFIGGGPQGTAGGVKITTFAILAVYLKNVIQPTQNVKIFGETISKNSVAISIRVYFLATSVLAFLFIILVILNQNENALHVIFFELIAIFSTAGFSIGLTENLGDIEKIFYIMIMLVGRIGVFTVLIALTGHSGVPRMGDDDGVKIQVG